MNAPVKSASAQRGHEEAASAFVTYDGAVADLNALSVYVRELERYCAALTAAQGKGDAPAGVEKVKDDDIARLARVHFHGNLSLFKSMGFARAVLALADPHKPKERRPMQCLVTLGASHAAAQPKADSVPVPTNADQAVLMALLGTNWLEKNAPERLKKADERGSAEPASEEDRKVYKAIADNYFKDRPDTAQARDAAQAVELTEKELDAAWKIWVGTPRPNRSFARAIERAVLAKNGLGGKHGE